MKDPVGVEIVDPVQDLIEQGLDHALWHLDLRLLASLYGSVELYDVLGKREGMEGERRGGWGREREGKKRIKREIAERGREGGKWRVKRGRGGDGEWRESRGRGEVNYTSVFVCSSKTL